jgi:hypothetical protein
MQLKKIEQCLKRRGWITTKTGRNKGYNLRKLMKWTTRKVQADAKAMRQEAAFLTVITHMQLIRASYITAL